MQSIRSPSYFGVLKESSPSSVGKRHKSPYPRVSDGKSTSGSFSFDRGLGAQSPAGVQSYAEVISQHRRPASASPGLRRPFSSSGSGTHSPASASSRRPATPSLTRSSSFARSRSPHDSMFDRHWRSPGPAVYLPSDELQRRTPQTPRFGSEERHKHLAEGARGEDSPPPTAYDSRRGARALQRDVNPSPKIGSAPRVTAAWMFARPGEFMY